MKILHIHQDYPDGLNRPFTKAVSSLIEHCEKLDDQVEHVVLSINRTSNPLHARIEPFEQGIRVVFWAIPLPYLYQYSIKLCCLLLKNKVAKLNVDLIHGHKLTSEGLFVSNLAKSLKLPFAVSVRGGSDLNNIRRLFDCRKVYKELYNKARSVFYTSPWAKKEIEQVLGTQERETVNFPNICEFSNAKPESIEARQRYTLVLSYHQYLRKGIIPTFEAMAKLVKDGKPIYLDVVGGGDDSIRKIIEDKLSELGLNDYVAILGKMEHHKLIELMQSSRGLILPALNETFGMAYIESLACGAPVVYMSGTGIDGFFDGMNIGAKLLDQKPESIYNAILEIENGYSGIYESVQSLIESGYLENFKGKLVAQQYLSSIRGSSD